MKEEKTKSKRKLIYTIALGAGVLLLAAVIVLTVYFVSRPNEMLSEAPPVVDPDNPPEQKPDEPDVPDTPPDEPSEPSTGDTVRFVSPIEGAAEKVEYGTVYNNETLRWGYFHKAIDYEATVGTEVRCVADGTVEMVSCDEITGNLIVVNHGGDLRSYYRFVEPADGLREGDTVSKGQTIGTVAEAYGIEKFDGVHLHFEMKLGKVAVDPANYFDSVLEEK